MPELVDPTAAVAAVLKTLDTGARPTLAQIKPAAKALARSFAQAHPGRSVEVRIPPYVAVQCIEGPRHTRGTPPNVVETDGMTWILLCAGRVTFAQMRKDGRLRSSGERADLSALLPHP